MEEWEFSDKAMEKLVAHSRSIGGVHPVDLRNMVGKMKSGLDNNADANMFTKQFENRLRKEREMVKTMDYDIQYLLYGIIGSRYF